MKPGYTAYDNRTGERLVFNRWVSVPRTPKRYALCCRPGVSVKRFARVPEDELSPKPKQFCGVVRP